MAQQKQFFRIEGDAVHLVRETVERTVRLQDLMDEVSKARGVATPLLPQGCRFFRQVGDCTVFVIEQSPTVRRVTWRRGEDGGERIKLAFPYVIWIIVFSGAAVNTSGCRVYYRTRPLGSLEDVVLKSNLGNVYAGGSICTGSMRVEGETLSAKAESFIAQFCGSGFNADLDSQSFQPAARNFPQVASLTTWQAETEKNPLFPLGIAWFEHGPLSQGGC